MQYLVLNQMNQLCFDDHHNLRHEHINNKKPAFAVSGGDVQTMASKVNQRALVKYSIRSRVVVVLSDHVHTATTSTKLSPSPALLWKSC